MASSDTTRLVLSEPAREAALRALEAFARDLFRRYMTAATYPQVDGQVAEFLERVRSSEMAGRLLCFHVEEPATTESVTEAVAWMLEELAYAEAERLHAERRRIPVDQLDPVFPGEPTEFVERLQHARVPHAVKGNAAASLLFRAQLEATRHPSAVARAPVAEPGAPPRPVRDGGRTRSPRRMVGEAVDRLQPQLGKPSRNRIAAALCDQVLGLPTNPSQISELLKRSPTRPAGSRRRPSTSF